MHPSVTREVPDVALERPDVGLRPVAADLAPERRQLDLQALEEALGVRLLLMA